MYPSTSRASSSSSSSSRRRQRLSDDEIWPEPFVEALVLHVAVDTSISSGPLAVAPALANLFRVCSTWRAISRSDLLWHNLTRRIWNRTHLLRATWQDEFIYCHRTTNNFRRRRSLHTILHFDPSDVIVDEVAGDNNDGFACRCLALTDLHLACGFDDGVVRLFDLTTHLHSATFRSRPRDRLGRFSSSVSGIIIDDNNPRVVFATLDGDIHIGNINDTSQRMRRAHLGDLLNDGVLVDFTGCNRWWIGLFAGVPGRSVHIWDGETGNIIFVGGSITDPDAVMGWHLLNELTLSSLGRVRLSTAHQSVMACTSLQVIIFDLMNQGLITHEEEFGRGGIIVNSFDSNNEAYTILDSRGVCSVRRVENSEQACGFQVMGGGVSLRGSLGCINSCYVFICIGGVVTVWGARQGERWYRFRERIGEARALIANDRHVAACCTDNTIHLWDFGAQ